MLPGNGQAALDVDDDLGPGLDEQGRIDDVATSSVAQVVDEDAKTDADLVRSQPDALRRRSWPSSSG
jgi:hypothetical protein